MGLRGLIRVALGLGVLLGGLWLWRLDYAARISTDVMDLVPVSKRDPELTLVRTMATERQGRVVVVGVEMPGAQASAVADVEQQLVTLLAAEPAFESVAPFGDQKAFHAAGQYLFEHRFELLWPQWLDAKAAEFKKAGEPGDFGEWAAERAAAELDEYLTRPEAVAMQELLPKDPLLLMGRVIDALKNGSGLGNGHPQIALVWALQKSSPMKEDGQGPVFAAVARVEAVVRAAHPDAVFRWTGVGRFAAESRARIEHEMTWLNALSLVAVAVVAGFGVSRVRRVWHLMPAVFLGMLGAWVVTTLVFERTHVLVFVVGALLSGVAIDYSFYLFMQRPAREGEAYWEKARRLLSPLLASALTTVLGFLLLLASDLPLLRQVGVFVSSGLLISLASALLWFGQVREHHLAVRRVVGYQIPDGAKGRRWAVTLLALLLAVGLSGVWRLFWKDDIRSLEVPSKELRANEIIMRQWMGSRSENELYVSVGPTLAEARESWERFRAWAEQNGGTDGMFSAGFLTPTTAQWTAAADVEKRLGVFDAKLFEALKRHGYEDDQFDAFREEWGKRIPLQLNGLDARLTEFSSTLSGPVAFLLGSGKDLAWVATAVEGKRGAKVPGTINLAQLETLNDLFARYRRSALNLGLIGLAVLAGSVFAMYGVKRGAGVFLVPLGATTFTFGMLGWFGVPMNMFHLLGAFLGVCLSHNYSIFMTENQLRGFEFPPSVRLSAWSTAASFGVLGFSSIPVVAALGSTVALIVGVAWLIAESVYVWRKPQPEVFRA